MAYFCTKTGARLIAPGEVGAVAEHDGSDAADAAEQAARAHIRKQLEAAQIGTSTDRPAPDAALAESAAKVALDVYQRAVAAKKPPEKPAAKADNK